MQSESLKTIGTPGLVLAVFTALNLTSLSAKAAEDNWPKFRGLKAGVAEDTLRWTFLECYSHFAPPLDRIWHRSQQRTDSLGT